MKKTTKQYFSRSDANGFSIPVLTIQTANKKHTYEIHAYNAGQSCRIAKGSTMEFGASIGSKTAGLVYVAKNSQGINATDFNVNDAGLWEWIQGHMQTGLTHDSAPGSKPAATPQPAAPIMDDDDANRAELATLKTALQNLFDDWTTLVGEDLKENNADVKKLWNATQAALR